MQVHLAPMEQHNAKPKVEGCAPVLLGTILYFKIEGIDFIIQLANRVAIESMYVWECPTYVSRGRSEGLWDIGRLEIGDVLREGLALSPVLHFIQSSQCVDLVK